jgi:hypothetical protein
MADQPTTPSGSRWEPTSEDAPSAESSRTAPDPLAEVPTYAPPIPSPVGGDVDGAPATTERRVRLRSRAILAGAATALTLGGGLAGFVIGHSTAGDDANGFRPANFSGQQPGGQFGDGTQQGPPSFGDRNGDGDGGFGQPPQDNNGSSDGTSSNSSATSVT